MSTTELSPERSRLSSIGDSAPPSEYSEGTSSCEPCGGDISPNWMPSNNQQNNQIIISSPSVTTKQLHNLNNSIDPDCDDNFSTRTTIIAEPERQQIESFFAGLKTNIFVSPSLINLYELVGKDVWRLLYTGIPVILHDKGLAKSRVTPRVTICLAERGSCFALWRDIIDHLSQYRVSGSSFHTMCLSTDHRKIIGLSFDSSDAANDLWQHIEYLTSDPENISLNVPGGRKKKKLKKLKSIVSLPSKSQISYPCQFHHVTSVIADDSQRYYSLQTYVMTESKELLDERVK